MSEKSMKTYYWSMRPGAFVNADTGIDPNPNHNPVFFGTVRQWFETILPTISSLVSKTFGNVKTKNGGSLVIESGKGCMSIFGCLACFSSSENIPYSEGGELSGYGKVFCSRTIPDNSFYVKLYDGDEFVDSFEIKVVDMPLLF